MVIIWYNPDSDIYEKGTMQDYDRLVRNSRNGDRFSILYEFNFTTIRLADKVLRSLNRVREISLV